MSAYTNNVPQSTQTIAATQPIIQDNFGYLQTFAAVDHDFTANSATAGDGYHKVIHLKTQGGDPGNLALTQLYSKLSTTGTEIYEKNSNGDILQITGLNVASKYAWSCGLLFQWGTESITAVGDFPVVTFPVPFPHSVFSVQATLTIKAGVPTIYSTLTIRNINLINFNGNFYTTNFTNSNVNGFTWLAVGY